MLTRRNLIALSAAQAIVPNLLIREARAQAPKSDFPNKPVRFIVPVAAGGPTDIVARMLAERLSKIWGQQVFIENKGGAGTNLGSAGLTGCIGCGCLSIQRCALANPGDRAGRKGAGPRYWMK